MFAKNSLSLLSLFILLFNFCQGQDIGFSVLNAPGPKTQGETLNVYSTIWNVGNISSPQTATRFYIAKTTNVIGLNSGAAIYADKPSLLLKNIITNSIPGNDYIHTTTSWVIPQNFPPGQYYIVGIVDANKNFSEINELNNVLYTPIEIKATSESIRLNHTANLNAVNIKGVFYSNRWATLFCSSSSSYSFTGNDVGKRAVSGSLGCATTNYNYNVKGEFNLPSGFRMKNVTKITLKFDARSQLGTSNNVKLVALGSGCSGTAQDIYNCISSASNNIATPNLPTVNNSFSYTTYTIDVPPGKFAQNLTKFAIGFIGQSHQNISHIKNIKCDINYFQDDFGCSRVQWWRDIMDASNNTFAKDHVSVNKNGDIIFRTTSNKIGEVSRWIFGQYNFKAIGPHLNYTVASNIVSNPSRTKFFYRTPSNQLHCVYWNGSLWLVAELGNVAGNTCAGSLAINNIGQVFFRTTSGGINCVYWDSGWKLAKLNDVVTSGCAGDLVINSKNHVYYRTTSGAINAIKWIGNGWGPVPLNNAVSWGCAGNLAINSVDQVFYKTTSGGINCLYWTGNNWAPSQLNNARTSGVTGDISVGADGKVYYVETGGKINYLQWTGTGWVNTPLTSGISVTSITSPGGIASGATHSNSGFYIQAGTSKLRRFYYGSSVGCDPSRSASPNNDQSTMTSGNISDFGKPLPESEEVPSDLSVFEQSTKNIKSLKTINLGNGKYQIHFKEHVPHRFSVYNLSGKLVKSYNSSIDNNLLNIDLSSLGQSIYLLKIDFEEGKTSEIIKLVR